MNKRKAFVLIELVVSLAISSFIIMGMMQGYRNAIKFVERAQQTMALNRKVSLLFNQMERDLTAAFIPTLAPQEKMPALEDQKHDQNNKAPLTKKQPDKEDNGKQDEQEEEKKKKEQQRSYFFTEIIEDATFTHYHKKHELLKRITFISTNPLQVYGEKKKRFVRIAYELEKDKEKSVPEKPIYKLLRKESFDILNADMKQKDPLEANETPLPIKTHVVADMIKGVSIECSMPKTKANAQNDAKNEQPSSPPSEEKELVTFSWGTTKKETHGMVPQLVTVSLLIWSEKLNDSSYFSCSIPIIAFTEKPEKSEKVEKTEKPEKPKDRARKTDPLEQEKPHETSSAQESKEVE